jgi:hypothetical protein
LPEANEGFRGPAPTSFAPFFRSTQRLHYATLFASIHRGLSRNAPRAVKSGDLQPGLENGERLCLAYEILREWAPGNDIELDQAVLLARGATSGKDIQLICCLNCRSVMLIDTLARRHELCTTCRRR